jgi:hypothetical protein
MVDASLAQRAYTTILKHFVETGQAPHYTDLAHTMGLGVEEARVAQREAAQAAVACWLVEGTDYIQSWAPFYNLPNQYRLTINGEQKWYGQ